MAQDNFLNEDLDFGIEGSSQADIQEFEAYMNDAPMTNVPAKDIKPASEEDKKQAEEKGKAKSDDEKVAEIKAAKQKEEEEARKFIEGDDDGDDDNKSTKSKSKVTEQNDDDDDNDSEDGNDEPLTEFEELAKDLYKVGIFTTDGDDDELPTTSEEFIERFNWEKQKMAEQMVYNFAGRHGEEARDLFNAVFVNGADPREFVSKYIETQNFKDMDLSDEDNQQRVVEAALRNQGWEDEDIRAEVKKLRLNSDLESTAQRHHKALVKTEEAQLARMQEDSKARFERKKQLEAQYSNNIRSILNDKIKTSEFDGIPVNRESANKAVDFLETKKWKLPTGELITDFDRVIMDLQNPQNHETKVKLALLLLKNYEPGKPLNLDLGPVAKKAVSKESNEVFNFIKNKKPKSSLSSKDNQGGGKKNFQFLDGL